VPVSEQIAVNRSIATARYYIFRDHFLLVGPPVNPANISASEDILSIFSDLRTVADSGKTLDVPVRFLSRYDKSATNIKESSLWLQIGQAPWATAYSTWYHQYIAFPIQALTAAILLQEYTLTDRGTYLSLPASLTNRTVIYKAATDNANDLLLNPAHLLVGAKAAHPDVADSFAKWCVSDAGQKVITTFQKNGQILYSGAPKEGSA
jgi:ABC-type tungstate transport system permease subunit